MPVITVEISSFQQPPKVCTLQWDGAGHAASAQFGPGRCSGSLGVLDAQGNLARSCRPDCHGGLTVQTGGPPGPPTVDTVTRS